MEFYHFGGNARLKMWKKNRFRETFDKHLLLLWIQTIVSIHWVSELGNNSIKMACLNGLFLLGHFIVFLPDFFRQRKGLNDITHHIIYYKSFYRYRYMAKKYSVFFFFSIQQPSLTLYKNRFVQKNYISTNLI